MTDQAKKDQISNELYAKRRAVVGTHVASQGQESDDESLLGYDSVEPGLPPASSDRRKWWLDNGAPARSTIKPPGNGYVPNLARPSNPFSPTPEPDWVKVDKPSAPPSRSASRAASIASNVSQTTRVRGDSSSRKLPPPFIPNDSAPEKPVRPSTFDGPPDEGRVHLKQTLRKAAPPKPSKPNLLRSESSQSTASIASTRSVPPPPEPRRLVSKMSTAANAMPPPSRVLSNPPSEQPNRTTAPQPPPPRMLKKPAPAAADPNPPLPPRRPTNGLMDDGDGQEMKEWAPLKPS